MSIYDRADELKFVVDDKFQVSDVIPNRKNAQVYLTPCNDMDGVNWKSLERTMKLLKNHDDWALSVQLHKLLKVR
jgi:organic radical activating enzyme